MAASVAAQALVGTDQDGVFLSVQEMRRPTPDFASAWVALAAAAAAEAVGGARRFISIALNPLGDIDAAARVLSSLNDDESGD